MRYRNMGGLDARPGWGGGGGGGGGAISPVPHHYWDPPFKASAKI